MKLFTRAPMFSMLSMTLNRILPLRAAIMLLGTSITSWQVMEWAKLQFFNFNFQVALSVENLEFKPCPQIVGHECTRNFSSNPDIRIVALREGLETLSSVLKNIMFGGVIPQIQLRNIIQKGLKLTTYKIPRQNILLLLGA